jgi:hypothetical protein
LHPHDLLPIQLPVGAGQYNWIQDVAKVQVLINLARPDWPASPVNGLAGLQLLEDIASCQREAHLRVDRRVHPTSATFHALVHAATPQIRRLTELPPVHGGVPPLKDQDYEAAARDLGCTPEAIKAVAMVESRGAPFLRSGKVKILYEPHLFGKNTRHVYDILFPQLSRLRQIHRSEGESYGGNEEQYVKLERAMLLHRGAALESASWGRFQIVGSHWNQVGASSVEDFVQTMARSEKEQLRQFVAFVRSNHLVPALKSANWPAFARGYNGVGYHRDKYDVKIAAAYQRLMHVKKQNQMVSVR